MFYLNTYYSSTTTTSSYFLKDDIWSARKAQDKVHKGTLIDVWHNLQQFHITFR
jgi:hypothetical protein